MKNTRRVRKFILIGAVLAPLVVCLLGVLAVWTGQKQISNFPKGYAIQGCYMVFLHEEGSPDEKVDYLAWDIRWAGPNTFGENPNSNPLQGYGCVNLPWMPFLPGMGLKQDYLILP